MTVRNDQLIRMFENGEREGENHTRTMRILPVAGDTLLVGFENCIYAHRSMDGIVTKYTGWRDEDTSTTSMRHIDSISASVTKDKRPQIVSWKEGLIKSDGAKEIEDLQKLS